jgi:hypothetical protein
VRWVARSAEREDDPGVRSERGDRDPTANRTPGGASMIVDALLDAALATVNFIVGMFPVSELDPFARLSEMLANLGALNYFLPIAETVAVVVAVFALFPVFLGITLSLWVVSQLRGSSSVG